MFILKVDVGDNWLNDFIVAHLIALSTKTEWELKEDEAGRVRIAMESSFTDPSIGRGKKINALISGALASLYFQDVG